jgi:protein-disulfide isomerase
MRRADFLTPLCYQAAMPIKPLWLIRCVLGLILIAGSSGIAGAQRDRSWRSHSTYPLIGDDGQRVPNHPVTHDRAAAIARLPGAVAVGNAKGRVTLVEFYDLNCPYCRVASLDVSDMVETNDELRLVLVPYPVLGKASVAAGRIELAVAKLATPEQFYAFHRQIYSRRGVVDAARALEVARALNLHPEHVTALADGEETAATLNAHVQLGKALGLAATPAFVIADVAVLGYPGRRSLQSIVDSVKDCGKVTC